MKKEQTFYVSFRQRMLEDAAITNMGGPQVGDVIVVLQSRH